MEDALVSGLDSLSPPDSHYVNAAWGWLELDNITEAFLELDRVTPPAQLHPDFLTLRWELLGRKKQWADALETAHGLVQIAPDRADSWIKQSYALHELKRTQEASDLLLSVSEHFPKISTIPYNLACYACQLGQAQASLTWLKQAMKIGGRESIRRMALQDVDLKPLWTQVKKLSTRGS
jgi:tetratricopeptide (TPR) repeat protein